MNQAVWLEDSEDGLTCSAKNITGHGFMGCILFLDTKSSCNILFLTPK